MKTSDLPVASDDDTTVACSFLKVLLGGCSSGGGRGGGSVSTHAFWRLQRRRRRSSGGATADGRGIVGSLRHQVRGAQGETPYLGLPDRMMMAFYRLPFWGASSWSKCWLEGWWSGVSSHTLMAAEIDGMALWILGVRCAEMGSRRRRLLSGVMVTSMAEWPDKVETSI